MNGTVCNLITALHQKVLLLSWLVIQLLRVNDRYTVADVEAYLLSYQGYGQMKEQTHKAESTSTHYVKLLSSIRPTD